TTKNIGRGPHQRIGDTEAIRRAALHAGADDFLAELPDGYGTVLGPEFEGGKELSVGQWQRGALARAFFRDAPFIILLDGGRVAESGSHDRLMALGGRYAELFTLQ